MKKIFYPVLVMSVLACSSNTTTSAMTENVIPGEPGGALYNESLNATADVAPGEPSEPAEEIPTIVMKRSNSEEDGPVMLLTNQGTVIAPMGKYESVPESKEGNPFIIVMGEKGYVYVNYEGEEMDYVPYIFDNGADLPSEGLVRIKDRETGKIGFANTAGYLIFEPTFFAANPFEDGKAKVAKEGTKEILGEHEVVIAKAWYYLDHNGNLTTEK